MKGMPEDMDIAVDESFAVCKLLNIGPDGASDRILSSPVPGDVGQGDKEILPLSLIMEHLIQSEQIKRLFAKYPPSVLYPSLGDSCVAEYIRRNQSCKLFSGSAGCTDLYVSETDGKAVSVR